MDMIDLILDLLEQSPMTPQGWNKSATRMDEQFVLLHIICEALWILLLIHYHAPADLVMPEPPVTAVTKSRAKKGDDTEHNQN
ncbi:hypothetical protein MJO28_006470 [Puccinia striiformis f. sp. tritici]|uniref:Uncharacterized protein n=1 Tax=Puccinia striiformis f. sp. tritici TaxID=168172 RepID=A0ACC0EJC2_9BASI|nr:hypothetical protein MJO28_006470 [Puccinia striiformis f. sp. tritici]